MRKIVKGLLVFSAVACVVAALAGCGSNSSSSSAASSSAASSASSSVSADKAAANKVAELIDAIYVKEWTDKTEAQCKEAKAAWDALTDAQKRLVEGENASPDYFGSDTGDASKDDPLNQDGIGQNEILVVSFGTSYNDSRAADIGGIEKAIQAAYPDWSVRRAFTSQIIINHILARDNEKIDNMTQALDRAVANGVKTLVIQPTHLMHGTEYDQLVAEAEPYKDKMTIKVAEPLLGEVGADEAAVNADKEAVAKAAVEAASADAKNMTDKTAIVLIGHGTSHKAKVTYSQMQTQVDQLGYKNVFVGTVEGEPESTACKAIIDKVKAGGFSNVVLRPLMVVAGDHANNDMSDFEDPESWASQFAAAGFAKDAIECEIAGLGEIPAIQAMYVAHTAAVM